MEQSALDDGPEFAGKMLDLWAHQRGFQLDFITPGKPVQNAFVQSFNGKFRDECLSVGGKVSLGSSSHGQRVAQALTGSSNWRYNAA